MNKEDKVDKTMQVVKCGAVVRLDDAVTEHGVLFMHPEMPLFKMFLNLDLVKKIVDKYHFELVTKESDEVQAFSVVVCEAAEPAILLPQHRKKKIIT